jgi:uncharacterized protein YjfI (DUF2170 family)
MEVSQVELRYANLLAGENFDRLNLTLKQPNIFNALGVGHYEIRHSNFLAWLLDPGANHGLQEIFLTRFLRDVFLDKRSKNNSLVKIPKLLKENILVHREWNSIDVLIEFETTVIALENKIFSGEHNNQLKRYQKIIGEHFPEKNQIFIYLTPFGIQSSQQDVYIEYGYLQVATHLQDILSLYSESLNNSVQIYIKDYINNLKMNVMADSNANDLARDIYKNHKELLDFIFENKPDFATDFRNLFENELINRGYIIGSRNKGYVRFLTPRLKELIHVYAHANGWPNKESFLFEVDFFWSGSKIKFYPIVPPGDDEIRQILIDAILKVEGAKEAWGKKWSTFLHTNENFDMNRMSEKDENDVKIYIAKFVNKIQKTVKDVEDVLLTQKDKIENYKAKYINE